MSEEKTIICIWLDTALVQSEDDVDVQTELRATVKDFRRFKNLDECLDFITDENHCRIFVITSINIAKLIVPLIHSVEQIESIYLFSKLEQSNNEWIKQYSKIKGIFRDVKLIYNRFLKDTTIRDNQQISISFISSNDMNSIDINRQDPSFMYFQLLKDILLNDYSLENEQTSRKEMIDFCRQQCSDNPSDIVLLDDFEETFIPEMSIYWYLKESFLFKMLNKALWTIQLDVLYRFRYFLRHLYNQIVNEAQKQRNQLSSMIVYRGQTMPLNQIEKFKRNRGGFLSFNNFLSTSLKRQVALNFLLGSENGVLFEIEIDPKIHQFPVVNVELISYLKNEEENEQELLFTMGSVFRILSIDKTPNYYLVKLILSNDTDEQLTSYTNKTREKLRTNYSFLSLLKLMDELSQFNYVDQFKQINKENFFLFLNPSLLASIHQTFGSIYLSRGQSKEAFEHLNISLRLSSNCLSRDNIQLTKTYNLLGATCLACHLYKNALEYSTLAIQCQSNDDDHQDISAIITANKHLAKANDQLENYHEAIQYLKHIQHLQKIHRGENDPSLIETYSLLSSTYLKMENYDQTFAYRQKAVDLQSKTAELNPEASVDFSIKTGILYVSQGQYEQALIHFNSALEIQQKYYLPDNPAIAKTFNHIADAYFNLKEYNQAILFYKKGLNIEQISLSQNHHSIPISYYNISRAYVALSSWIDALEYCQKSIEILQNSAYPNQYYLAYFTFYIGFIYHQQNEFQIALISYEESIQIFENAQIEPDTKLTDVYYRTGQVYQILKRYDDALKSFQKTLQMELKILSENDRAIADTYSSISSVYLSLKQYDQAISFAEQALNQLLKTLPGNDPQVLQHQFKITLIQQKAQGKPNPLENLVFN